MFLPIERSFVGVFIDQDESQFALRPFGVTFSAAATPLRTAHVAISDDYPRRRTPTRQIGVDECRSVMCLFVYGPQRLS